MMNKIIRKPFKISKRFVHIAAVFLFAITVTVFNGFSVHAQADSQSETVDDVKWECNIISDELMSICPAEPGTLSGEVIIPEQVNGRTVTGIGGFKGASKITSVQIPDTVIDIENEAFSGCTGLKEIVIPEGVEYIRENAFYNCSNLMSIDFGKNVSTIEEYAFCDCPKLKTVHLPKALTELRESVFRWCTALQSVSIQGKVSTINLEAFKECNSLESIEVTDDNAFYSSHDGVLYNKSQTHLIFAPRGIAGSCEISNDTTCIEREAFYRCGGLNEITGGANVTEIGYQAFYLCSNVENMTFFNKAEKIGSSAFYGCYLLTEVTIPANVTKINEELFESCKDMNAILVEDGNTAYSSVDGILYDKAQTRVIQCPGGWSKSAYKTPETVTVIGSGAFISDNLTEVILTEGVTTIEEDAFCECANLNSITIPKSLKTVAACAFYEPFTCIEGYEDIFGIHEVTYTGTKEQWEQFLQSESNENQAAFLHVDDLKCLGVSEEVPEVKDTVLKGEFKVDSEWGTACNVTFTITNTSDHVVKGWKALFTSAHDISSIWCAQMSSHVSGSFVIENMAWNGTVNPGESVSFGFIMDKNDDITEVLKDVSVIEAK